MKSRIKNIYPILEDGTKIKTPLKGTVEINESFKKASKSIEELAEALSNLKEKPLPQPKSKYHK